MKLLAFEFNFRKVRKVIKSTHILWKYVIMQLTFMYTQRTQSPNHGEYVFDAGSEASKQQWIKTIQQFSGKQSQNPVPNGRLPP